MFGATSFERSQAYEPSLKTPVIIDRLYELYLSG